MPDLVTRTLDARATAIELLASGCVAAPKLAEEDIKAVLVELRTIVCVFRISDVCAGGLTENVIHGSVAHAAFSRSSIPLIATTRRFRAVIARTQSCNVTSQDVHSKGKVTFRAGVYLLVRT